MVPLNKILGSLYIQTGTLTVAVTALEVKLYLPDEKSTHLGEIWSIAFIRVANYGNNVPTLLHNATLGYSNNSLKASYWVTWTVRYWLIGPITDLGNKDHFRETFHDNGPTPMAELLRHYATHGFNGPLRPDHAPVMFGEAQGTFDSGLSAGYEVTRKIFAIGYIKGICGASGIGVK